VRRALRRQIEEATYEAALAARRHQAVDPDKRLVARELEGRWEAALGQVRQLEELDRAALLSLAHDLPAAWNAPGVDAATKQRIVRILVHEVLLDLDATCNDVLVTIHWKGGRHTELRVPRVRARRGEPDCRPSAVEVMRKIGGQFSDRDTAATMNRMQCPGAGRWTTERARELRKRLGISPFDPGKDADLISINEAARRLGIATRSVYQLICEA